MRIGKLDRRIVLEVFTTAKDSWNHDTETWSTLGTVWATKDDKAAGEKQEADQKVALNKTVFWIRYRTDVNELCRVNYNSKYYYVTGVEEVGRQEGLKLHTEQRDNG